MKLILDTNFLMIPFTQKFSFFSEIDRVMMNKYNLIIFEKSFYELDRVMLTAKKRKDKDIAKMSKQYFKQKINEGIIDLIKLDEENKRHLDLLILDLVKENPKDYIIATQDKELKRKLKEINAYGVVTLRKGDHLELVVF